VSFGAWCREVPFNSRVLLAVTVDQNCVSSDEQSENERNNSNEDELSDDEDKSDEEQTDDKKWNNEDELVDDDDDYISALDKLKNTVISKMIVADERHEVSVVENKVDEEARALEQTIRRSHLAGTQSN